MKSKRSILVIGMGHVFNYHVRAISEAFPDAAVFATDIDSSKEKVAKEMGVIFVPYANKDAAIKAADIVVVCVPCAEHHAVAKEALLAGKTVLLEKPPTKTVAEFDDLLETAKSVPGAKLVCAIHAAHDLTIKYLVAEMKEGVHQKFGKLIKLQAEFDDPYEKDGHIFTNLGSSHEDSAPNALSVFARFTDISWFDIMDAEFDNSVPAAEGVVCLESSGRVDYKFPGGEAILLTNWIRGLNRKVTFLTFRDDAGKETLMLLHHSKQSIFIGKPGDIEDNLSLLINLDNGVPRLDNHYSGVYADFTRMIESGENNMELGLTITQLWIGAYEMAGIGK
jgi:predicted dehydrogenase